MHDKIYDVIKSSCLKKKNLKLNVRTEKVKLGEKFKDFEISIGQQFDQQHLEL